MSIAMHTAMLAPFRDIFEEHVNEAAWLWQQRAQAVISSNHTPSTIKKLETRLQHHLSGLQVSPCDAWHFCTESMATFEDGGEMFVMAVVAFNSADTAKIKTATEMALCNDNAFKGFTSALAWLGGNIVHPWIKRFLCSKTLKHQHLAITACSLRREDPGSYLNALLRRTDDVVHEPLYTRALRLVGELKRHDLLLILRRISQEAISQGHADRLFWSCWSRRLLGDSTADNALKAIVISANTHQMRAMDMALRCLPVREARQWISELAQEAKQVQQVIHACAILGDSHAIDWLITQMNNHSTAQLAGLAFTVITGVDLVAHTLTQSTTNPLNPSEAENDDELSDDEAGDDNAHLPWPDPKKVSLYWRQLSTRFTPGQRYFFGAPPNVESITAILAHGSQTQRQAAALEYALLDPAHAYPNSQAKVGTQV